MRISDWSSDVCSSDLNVGERGTRMLAHVPMPSDHHAEGLKDAVRLDEADGSDDRRDADHDIAEQSRHAEQEGGDTPDEAERAFDNLVHDNVVDVVDEITRHGSGKGVEACRGERPKEWRSIGKGKRGPEREEPGGSG